MLSTISQRECIHQTTLNCNNTPNISSILQRLFHGGRTEAARQHALPVPAGPRKVVWLWLCSSHFLGWVMSYAPLPTVVLDLSRCIYIHVCTKSMSLGMFDTRSPSVPDCYLRCPPWPCWVWSRSLQQLLGLIKFIETYNHEVALVLPEMLGLWCYRLELSTNIGMQRWGQDCHVVLGFSPVRLIYSTSTFGQLGLVLLGWVSCGSSPPWKLGWVTESLFRKQFLNKMEEGGELT